MARNRNPIARDLRSPKYRKRVVKSKVKYDRKKQENTGQNAQTSTWNVSAAKHGWNSICAKPSKPLTLKPSTASP